MEVSNITTIIIQVPKIKSKKKAHMFQTILTAHDKLLAKSTILHENTLITIVPGTLELHLNEDEKLVKQD